MKRHLLFGICLILISGSLLYSQPSKHRGGPPGRGQEMRQELIEDLKLTDSQKEQFEKLMLAQRRKMIDTRAKLQQKRLDMHELMNAEKPDRSAIEKGLKAVSDVQYQQKLDRIDHWFAVNAILTPEQQKIWKQHLGPMGHNMRGQKGMMRMREHMRDKDEDEEEDD